MENLERERERKRKDAKSGKAIELDGTTFR